MVDRVPLCERSVSRECYGFFYDLCVEAFYTWSSTSRTFYTLISSKNTIVFLKLPLLFSRSRPLLV